MRISHKSNYDLSERLDTGLKSGTLYPHLVHVVVMTVLLMVTLMLVFLAVVVVGCLWLNVLGSMSRISPLLVCSYIGHVRYLDYGHLSLNGLGASFDFYF